MPMLPTIKRYGEFLNSQDILKFIAILLMVVDHIGQYYFEDNLWFRVIGRMCIPIWFFFIGYSKSQLIDKQLIGGAILLILFDVLSHAPIFPVNILVTVIFCRLVQRHFLNNYLAKADFSYYDIFMLCFIILLFYLPTFFLFEYGSLVLVFTSLGRLIQMGRRDNFTIFLAVLGVAVFCTPEIYGFKFTMIQSIVVVMGISTMVAVLYRYSLHHYRISWHNPLGFGIMLFGRNTLYFYVVHLMIIIAIDHYLHPERYLVIHWLKK